MNSIHKLNITMKRTPAFILYGTFLLLLLSVKPPHKITVYTIGDSTMADKDTTLANPETGWGQVLPSFFDTGKVDIKNYAVNGRSTKSFVDEGRWKAIADKLQPGDYVFIEFGHNDEKKDKPALYTDPKSSYREYLTKFVNETRAKGAYPILMTPIVRRKFEAGTLVDTHGDYPAAVRETARSLNVPLIDMEEKTRRLITELGAVRSTDVFLHFNKGETLKFSEGKHDDTHLSRYGALMVAQQAVQGMRELKLPLVQFLKKANEDILFEKGTTTSIYLNKAEMPVVHTSLSIVQHDVQTVFEAGLTVTNKPANARIIAGTIGQDSEIERLIKSGKINVSDIKGKWEGFLITTIGDNGHKNWLWQVATAVVRPMGFWKFPAWQGFRHGNGGPM